MKKPAPRAARLSLPKLNRPLQTAAWLTLFASHPGFAQDTAASTAAVSSKSTSGNSERAIAPTKSQASQGENGNRIATESSLPAVTVTANYDAPEHLTAPVATGALGTRSQLDTPFSTTVVTSEELEDRQVNKLGDVFAGDASVSDNGSAYTSWATYVAVRGLQLDWQNGFKIDGMPFISYSVTLPYEQFESVQLLKGPSGFMYGFGSPGGVVNYVTKKPTDAPVRSVGVGYRNDGVWTEHADLGARFGPDKMFGARINATHEEGKTYNGGNINRDSVILDMDARLTKDLSVNFAALYQERRATGQTLSIYTAQYVGTTLPKKFSGAADLGGADQYLNTNLQLYTAGVHYQITPDWTFSTTYSFNKASRERNESDLYLQDGAGDYSEHRWNGNESNQFNQWQAMFEGSVKTGPVSHQIVLGAAWQKQFNNYSANPYSATLGTGNLYVPNPNRHYSTGGFKEYRNSEITQKSMFASDTIKLTQRWSVLGGVRYTSYQQDTYTVAGAPSSSYDENGVLTPTVAIMYKLQPNTTIYASYVEALEQGTRVGQSYANYGQQLDPLRSKQYELGIKSEHTRWSATAAIFRIERGAQYANSDNVYVADGKSIYQGIELGASTRLGPHWGLGGNLMWLDTWYSKGTSYDGNRVAGAPTFVATAFLDYSVPMVPGLKLGVGAKFTGNTEVRASGNLATPGYLLVNFGASYATSIGGHDVTFRAALDNVANRRYWQFQYADYVAPGEPRTISLNAKIDF
jgi:iron complex outermembrane receptor protein